MHQRDGAPHQRATYACVAMAVDQPGCYTHQQQPLPVYLCLCAVQQTDCALLALWLAVAHRRVVPDHTITDGEEALLAAR